MKSCGPIGQVNTGESKTASRRQAQRPAAGRWVLRELLNCTANSDSLAHSCDRWRKFSCGKKMEDFDEHKIEFNVIKFNFMFTYMKR